MKNKAQTLIKSFERFATALVGATVEAHKAIVAHEAMEKALDRAVRKSKS